MLEPCWLDFEANLRPIWSQLGAKLGEVVANLANLRPLRALWEPTWDHLAPTWANLPVWGCFWTVFARVLGTMLGRFVACSWALRSVLRAPVATSSLRALAALAALAALFALLRVFLWCVLSRCLRCSGPRERRSKSSNHLKPPAQAAQRPSKGVGDRMGLLSRSSGGSSFFLTCLQLTPFTRFPFHDSQVFLRPGSGGLREAHETLVSQRSVCCRGCNPISVYS